MTFLQGGIEFSKPNSYRTSNSEDNSLPDFFIEQRNGPSIMTQLPETVGIGFNSVSRLRQIIFRMTVP